MVQTLCLHGSNVGFAWFKRWVCMVQTLAGAINPYFLHDFRFHPPILPSSPEMPMYKGLSAWEDGGFILPSSSHIPPCIPPDDEEDKNHKNTTHDGCGLRPYVLFFRPCA